MDYVATETGNKRLILYIVQQAFPLDHYLPGYDLRV
jgi:hypothetical protein